jgi:two-component system sensor histidine kinase AlgZ
MYDDPRSADRMIGQLSQLLRLSLRTSHSQEVPLRDELEVLACYLGLMKARFGHRLHADVEAAHDALDALVPSLLLQPIVENAIRHGNASRASGGTIAIRVDRVGASVHVSVTDDGPGAPDGIDVFSAGIGLSATRDRLRLLYGGEHRFEAGNRGAGFVVTIALPYRRAAIAATAAEASAGDSPKSDSPKSDSPKSDEAAVAVGR